MAQVDREAKRAYDRSPEARARKAARRARPEQRQRAKAYNESWYALNGVARSAASAANRRRYALSQKGRAKLNELEQARNARKLKQHCTCCTREQFFAVYDLANLLGSEVDHKVPLALGGMHCCANLQLLSPAAHREKTNHDMRAIMRAKHGRAEG